MNKKSIIITVITLLIVVGVGGYIYFDNSKNGQESEKTASKQVTDLQIAPIEQLSPKEIPVSYANKSDLQETTITIIPRLNLSKTGGDNRVWPTFSPDYKHYIYYLLEYDCFGCTDYAPRPTKMHIVKDGKEIGKYDSNIYGGTLFIFSDDSKHLVYKVPEGFKHGQQETEKYLPKYEYLILDDKKLGPFDSIINYNIVNNQLIYTYKKNNQFFKIINPLNNASEEIKLGPWYGVDLNDYSMPCLYKNQDNKFIINIDDQLYQAYDEYFDSPDHYSNVCYYNKSGNYGFLVLKDKWITLVRENGKEELLYPVDCPIKHDNISKIIYSSDSSKVAYILQNCSGKFDILINNQLIGTYNQIIKDEYNSPILYLSDDGSHIAYIAQEGQNSYLFVDDKIVQDFTEFIDMTTHVLKSDFGFKFSPKGNQYIYKIGKCHENYSTEECSLFYNGREIFKAAEFELWPYFSNDENHLAYIYYKANLTKSFNKETTRTVIDGKEIQGRYQVIFSPNSNHYISIPLEGCSIIFDDSMLRIPECNICKGGEEMSCGFSDPVYSSDSKHWFVIAGLTSIKDYEGRFVLIVDGKLLIGPYSGISNPKFILNNTAIEFETKQINPDTIQFNKVIYKLIL